MLAYAYKATYAYAAYNNEYYNAQNDAAVYAYASEYNYVPETYGEDYYYSA